ncbi:MAG: phytoene desaturase family protein [Bacteroidota bacterium]
MSSSNQTFDLIVIGSGIGGLTVASLMSQMKHKRVLVLERHFKLGGFTHSFTRPKKRSWDVGLHYVGEMGADMIGRQLFDLITQQKVQWNKIPSPFEKFVYPDFTFDVPDDEHLYQQALIERFPHERAGIEQYFKDILRVADWYRINMLMQSAPALIRLPTQLIKSGAKGMALMTTAEYLNRLFKDVKLKAVLASQWGDYGLPPAKSAFAIHALIVAHYFKGGYYPAGGAETIPKSIVPIVEARDGQCLVNHTVTEVIVRNGRAIGVKVMAKAGQGIVEKEFFAPVIVSDAGAYTTFKHLLPENVPLPFRHQLEQVAGGYGFITVYLGLKENPSKLGFHGENHWIYSGYDHDEMCQRRNEILEGKPSYCYLSFPSQKDPQAVAHTAEIITALDYATVEKWRNSPWLRRGTDYQDLKNKLAEALIDFVNTRYPGFKDLVDYQEVSTPITVETFTGHFRGSIYGIPATPERFRLSWLKATTPVRNLYLTGTDVAALGILGALMGGVATSAHLLGSSGIMQILSMAKRFHQPNAS